jgi:hemoglobin
VTATTPLSLYEAAGGAAGLQQLAEAWHRRVLTDAVVSHAFQHGFSPDHTARLAAYWAEALGGPTSYTSAHGDESSVVRMHSGNGVHPEMDERAVACFAAALDDVGLATGPVGAALREYFAWATEAISRYSDSADDVPDGLAVPRWTWTGPVS